jgi:hypothetical protein
MKEDIEPFVLKEVRGPFYNAAILPVINWLERKGGRYSEDEPPCPKAVWEHKKMLFKSKEIDKWFTKLTADFHEPLDWQQRLGSKRHVLGFKCGHVYDSRKFEFRLGNLA